MRIRRVRLVAETASGTFGRDLAFADGLNLVRADNTHGKSTVLQSIVYALGLEGMLDSRHDVPLPPAMTDTLRDVDGTEHTVTESFVIVEIENGRGESLTSQRWVTHPAIDRHLVRTWRGPALSNASGVYEQDDYFVRRPGSAVSSRGFHHMLAEFLGWELPVLARDEGTEAPLYLETIFPLVYVEQKRGWGGIQATMPTYGIPNARRRAIEFILGLGVYRRVRERSELLSEIERLSSEYRQTLAAFRGRLEGSGVVLQGLGSELPTRWPEIQPGLLAAVGEDEWVPLAAYLALLRERHRNLVEKEVPTAEEASRELTERLRANENLLSRLMGAGAEVRQRLALDEDQLLSLGDRIEALEEDRRRYRDAITLRDLGSDEVSIFEGDDCPACHRPLPVAMIVPEVPPPMSLDQNIAFIVEQVQTFRLMAADAERHRDVETQRLAALRARIDELRQDIRATRSTLTSPSGSPSIAAVREQLRLEDRIEALDSLERDFFGLLERLRPLVDEASAARQRLAALPKERLDAEDEARLDALELSVVSQLAEYGFRSFPVDTIGISRDNYLPTREGFDLGFVTSASDAIRIVWSYLLGLLEVARVFKTNHPGLVLFDEPRQQAADPVSFQALLRRAADVDRYGQQVVFATSEPEESLAKLLAGLEYSQTNFDGMALERLTSREPAI
jgi:hypothetical protein